MLLAPEICERARLARDPRFDGRFFIAVRTTRIYCRPICPAPPAKSANVRYYPSAAAAQEAGFRPCLRCRPEAAPGSPAWRGTSATVTRALRLIEDGALDHGTVDELAARLGIGERHLRRLFMEHLGAAPLSVARTRRIQVAKTLLDETDLRMTEVAFAAGFGSVRQFNTTMRGVYGRPPRALRGKGRRATRDEGAFVLRLPYRPPFDWEGLLAFFRPRATAGIESVEDGVYRRTFSIDGAQGTVEVRRAVGVDALVARVRTTNPRTLPAVVTRLRRQFDLTADPMEIGRHLRRQRELAPGYVACQGVRVPGAFDGFEVGVRAILGQQVTVRGATTLTGRLVARYGDSIEAGGVPARSFPTPAVIADADLGEIGVPGARRRAVVALGRAVRDGDLALDGGADVAETTRCLRALPGIGEWTAEYIAMRALGDPDAFPASDLGLRKALRPGELVSARDLRKRAEAWRPWRAYAAVLLWRSISGSLQEVEQ